MKQKIYVLRNKAIEIATNRGHVISGKFHRDFRICSGRIESILYTNCLACGARLELCDCYNKIHQEIYGEAFYKNCKFNSCKLIEFTPINIFSHEPNINYHNRSEKIKNKLIKKFG
jgi:hypothetical protein